MKLITLNAHSAGLLVAVTSAGMAQELPRPPSAGVFLGTPIPSCLARSALSRPQSWRCDGYQTNDVPVMQPTKLELVINRKTAGALGPEIPPILRTTARLITYFQVFLRPGGK
jgi:hypothetical protein